MKVDDDRDKDRDDDQLRPNLSSQHRLLPNVANQDLARLRDNILEAVVYAQHGREPKGIKSPVCEPVYAKEHR